MMDYPYSCGKAHVCENVRSGGIVVWLQFTEKIIKDMLSNWWLR